MSRILLQHWARTLRRHGPARAVAQASDEKTATFHELDQRSDTWLRTFASRPARLAGVAVVFAVPNGIGWFEVFLALLKAGAVAVPVDAAEPRAAQREIARSLRAGFWWDGGQLQELPKAKRYRDPAICLIKLTSGTTGQPRPLVFTDAQMLADARQVTSTMAITPRDLNYALIPLGHSYGLGNLSVPVISDGVPLVCGSAALPHAIAADFERWKPTVFPGVPAIWRALAASDVPLSSLRLGISAGAPLPMETARDFEKRFRCRLHSFYGSSETGGIAYDRTGAGTLAGTVGKSLGGVTLKLLPGQRLQVSSAAVMTYGNRRRSGRWGAWFMADRVEKDAFSRVRLLGRRGSTVKIAGRRVDLTEVAARVKSLPGVMDAWVGISEGPEPVLGAAVVTRRPTAELRGELLNTTATWKVPKRWLSVPALPVTARGKIDRQSVQALVFGR